MTYTTEYIELVKKEFQRICGCLDISSDDIDAIRASTNASWDTLWLEKDFLSDEEIEFFLSFMDLCEYVYRLTQNDDVSASWLKNQCLPLKDAPLEIMKKEGETGIQKVIEYLLSRTCW